jgi:hypothetical protein
MFDVDTCLFVFKDCIVFCYIRKKKKNIRFLLNYKFYDQLNEIKRFKNIKRSGNITHTNNKNGSLYNTLYWCTKLAKRLNLFDREISGSLCHPPPANEVNSSLTIF